MRPAKRLKHRALDSFSLIYISLFSSSILHYWERQTTKGRKFSSILLLVQSSAPSSLFFLSLGGREEEKKKNQLWEREKFSLDLFQFIHHQFSLFSYFFLLFRSVGAQGQSFLPIPVFRLGFLCVQRGLCGRSFRRLLYVHTHTDRERGAHLLLFFFGDLILFSSCLCCLRTQSGRESKNGVSTALGTSAGRSWPRSCCTFIYLFIYFFFSWLWFDFFFLFFLLFFPSFDLPVAEIHRVFSISCDWSRGHWPIHRIEEKK